jgi:TolA-binding protein
MKVSLIFSFVLLLISSCNSEEGTGKKNLDKDAARNEIKALEKVNFSNSELVTKESAEALLKSYLTFTKSFPDDSLSADYLFKASGLAIGIQAHEKGIEIIDNLAKNYPDYELIDEAVFQKAFVLDFQLNNKEAAEKAYREFVNKYPNSPLVKEAKGRLETINLSEEELIDLFELKSGR